MTPAGRARAPAFAALAEVPGEGATAAQLARLYDRYRLAARNAGESVLEVACGSGIGLRYLATKARSVVGGDLDEGLLQVAARSGSRSSLVRLDASALPFRDHSFDLVLLAEAIYYLPDPRRFVHEARRALRPDGRILIATVNPQGPGFIPSPLSVNYYSAVELSELLEDVGFAVDLLGAFPSDSSLGGQVRSMLRRAVSRLGFVPSTLRGRAFLKRLFYGRLHPLPVAVSDGMADVDEPRRIDLAAGPPPFAIIYAIGRAGRAD